MSESACCKNNIDVQHKEMKAIGILGSPHEDGNTAYLLEEILRVLRKELKTEMIFLKNYEIRPCEGCCFCEDGHECIIEDDMQKLYPKIMEASVIILASPSYMGGVTSRMRAFMERTWYLRKGQLENKIGTWIVVGRRNIGGTINEMNEYLDRQRVIKVPGCSGYAFRKGDILKDEEALKEVRMLGERILKIVKDVHSS
jgi:multimeric flavodoxin WrbA